MSTIEAAAGYIHPDRPDLSDPVLAARWYDKLTAGKAIPKDIIGHLIRQRDPQTTSLVDQMYNHALMNLTINPKNETARANFVQALGIRTAFHYINGMHVYMRNDSPVEKFEEGVEGRVKLGSSHSVQLQREAQIEKKDRVLELFCGVGYGSFFLSLMQPNVLISVDKFTPAIYDLEKTFFKTRTWLFKDIDDEYKAIFDKILTPPRFFQADATNLPADLHGWNFTKGIMHPPYGRESLHIPTMENLTELDAFALWVKSLNHVSQIQQRPLSVYSVVPEEWADTLMLWQSSGRPTATIARTFVEKLKANPYYLAHPEKDIPDQFTDKLDRLKGVRIVRDVKLLDTRKFPLKIVVTDHRQAA